MSLKPIISPLLNNAQHGFFTRLGGVSTGPFKALNCGFGSPEDVSVIRQNRALIAQHIGVNANNSLTANQVHSVDVITISKGDTLPAASEADALVTQCKNVALGVLTADCAPVLFHDVTTNTIGAAHAGWRGAFGGILEATVDAMCALGAVKHQIVAAVGPCISQQNYEVGQEFLETFLQENSADSQFFINAPHKKYLFDLPSFTLNRLRNHGILSAEWTGQCTYAHPETFYSFRYAQHNKLPEYGRMLSVITN